MERAWANTWESVSLEMSLHRRHLGIAPFFVFYALYHSSLYNTWGTQLLYSLQKSLSSHQSQNVCFSCTFSLTVPPLFMAASSHSEVSANTSSWVDLTLHFLTSMQQPLSLRIFCAITLWYFLSGNWYPWSTVIYSWVYKSLPIESEIRECKNIAGLFSPP